MQKIKNEKGFTLVEILVVIAIIAILFVVLLPQIDGAMQKTRETQVRNDFHTYQMAAHAYMLETVGINIDTNGYNKHLDKAMDFDLMDKSVHKDPWGSSYELDIPPSGSKIIITSNGLDEQLGSGDDLLLAIYYHKGNVDSCTSGFKTNNIALTSVTLPVNGVCGDDPA